MIQLLKWLEASRGRPDLLRARRGALPGIRRLCRPPEEALGHDRFADLRRRRGGHRRLHGGRPRAPR